MDIFAIIALLGLASTVFTQLLKQFGITGSDTAKLVCLGLAIILTVARAVAAGGEWDAVQLSAEAGATYLAAVGLYETIIRPYWPWKSA